LWRSWKRRRLLELGFGVPDWLRFISTDFAAGESWYGNLASAGFDYGKPAIVVSTGASMYLTQDANAATLRQIATLAAGSILAMTFLLPVELTDPEARPGLEMAVKGARASRTPFLSFFTPPEMLALAREAGLGNPRHVSAADLAQRYFVTRTDGLRPPNNAEEFLVAST
jgi:O-methyltransferase involved in polyketide biosynthesis